MILTEQTKIGMTIGKLIGFVGIFATVFTIWMNVNVKLTEMEIRIQELEKGRLQNANNIETIRRENREDHATIMQKLDVLIIDINKE